MQRKSFKMKVLQKCPFKLIGQKVCNISRKYPASGIAFQRALNNNKEDVSLLIAIGDHHQKDNEGSTLLK